MKKNSESSALLLGYLTSARVGEEFGRKLVSVGALHQKPRVLTLVEQHKHPDLTQEVIEKSADVITHSLGELSIKGAWPRRNLVLLNPAKNRPRKELVINGARELAHAISESVLSGAARRLVTGGLKETFAHPIYSIDFGNKGAKNGSIDRIANLYKDNSNQDSRPHVTVVTVNHDGLFKYDEDFEQKVKAVGFDYLQIEGEHNAPYRNNPVILEALKHVIHDATEAQAS